MFEIRQKIPDDYINGDYADIDDIHVGFVSDEFLAQEFCNTHDGCSYGQVFETKYLNDLRAHLISSVDDLTLLKIPVKKWEEWEE